MTGAVDGLAEKALWRNSIFSARDKQISRGGIVIRFSIGAAVESLRSCVLNLLAGSAFAAMITALQLPIGSCWCGLDPRQHLSRAAFR